ncbi:hypothetical protein SS50377_22627 [Spironucleus salmonicida]|uniref:Uncharacterized protein n=1 Tax=Spironucleus salmonicida TaxID=348837 RepID=V6M267_9EUKA|nr:hypothetical protein SS50377_22627 [Spironucleus salmonicida]|eukprot:EST47309.1 Hypothetical protein SS50377_12627 [Spironucleus salmonicida]
MRLRQSRVWYKLLFVGVTAGELAAYKADNKHGTPYSLMCRCGAARHQRTCKIYLIRPGSAFLEFSPQLASDAAESNYAHAYTLVTSGTLAKHASAGPAEVPPDAHAMAAPRVWELQATFAPAFRWLNVAKPSGTNNGSSYTAGAAAVCKYSLDYYAIIVQLAFRACGISQLCIMVDDGSCGTDGQQGQGQAEPHVFACFYIALSDANSKQQVLLYCIRLRERTPHQYYIYCSAKLAGSKAGTMPFSFTSPHLPALQRPVYFRQVCRTEYQYYLQSPFLKERDQEYFCKQQVELDRQKRIQAKHSLEQIRAREGNPLLGFPQEPSYRSLHEYYLANTNITKEQVQAKYEQPGFGRSFRRNFMLLKREVVTSESIRLNKKSKKRIIMTLEENE